MSRTRDELHVRFDPGSGLVRWKAQRNDIVNRDNSGSAREQRWSKVGNMEDVYSCPSCSCRTCQLFPQHFFKVLIVRGKSWNSLHLIGKWSAPLPLHWLWS